MEDRNLYNKKRERRKQRIKKNKRKKNFKRIFAGLVFLIILLVAFFLIKAVVGFVENMLNTPNEQVVRVDDNENSEGIKEPEVLEKPEKLELSLSVDDTEERKTTNAKPLDTNITTEMKIENLQNRINTFIDTNEIQKDELSVSYFNIDTNEGYNLNNEVDFGVGRANNFIIAMEIYDLTSEKGYSLEESISILPKDNENTNPVNYAVKELVKIMLQTDSRDARTRLIQYIEDKTSKNWYDEINSRYDIDITHNNQMTGDDSIKMLRKLFELRKVSTEERVRYNSDRIEKYLEIINFMRKQNSQSNISLDIMRKAQFSENIGNDYMDYTNMGYVIGDTRYVFVINSGHNNKAILYGVLDEINEWYEYYN